MIDWHSLIHNPHLAYKQLNIKINIQFINRIFVEIYDIPKTTLTQVWFIEFKLK